MQKFLLTTIFGLGLVLNGFAENEKIGFDDAMKVAPVTEDTPTYHNWGNAEKAKRIDYILTSTGDATVFEYHVLDNCHDGAYSSDHASIYVKLKIND